MLSANPGKNLTIKVGEVEYARYPVKTPIVKKGDDLVALFQEYVLPHVQPGDLIAVSEKIVAISQGRSYLLTDIKPGWFAKFLVKFVHKSPYGIGLGSPYTMELAVREVGVLRMLVAAAVAAITKPFGVRGMFYKVAGKRVNAIDGPCEYSLPPSNQSAKLPPANPEKVVLELKEKLNYDFAIIDANDLGVEILGNSSKEYSDDLIKAIFKDNPLGQTREQTPVAVVRRV